MVRRGHRYFPMTMVTLEYLKLNLLLQLVWDLHSVQPHASYGVSGHCDDCYRAVSSPTVSHPMQSQAPQSRSAELQVAQPDISLTQSLCRVQGTCRAGLLFLIESATQMCIPYYCPSLPIVLLLQWKWSELDIHRDSLFPCQQQPHSQTLLTYLRQTATTLVP